MRTVFAVLRQKNPHPLPCRVSIKESPASGPREPKTVTRSRNSYTRDKASPGPDLAYRFSPPNPKSKTEGRRSRKTASVVQGPDTCDSKQAATSNSRMRRLSGCCRPTSARRSNATATAAFCRLSNHVNCQLKVERLLDFKTCRTVNASHSSAIPVIREPASIRRLD